MNTSQSLQQLQQTGLNLHRNGQLAQAESCYRQILSAQPRNADILHLLGVLCYQTDRNAEAIKLIEQALKLEPRNADFMSNLGLALRANGETERAISILQRALQINPQDLDIQTNLGNAYQALNRHEEAAGCYRRVLRSNPRDSEIREALCFALQALGNQSQQSGRYQQAEASYQEAVSLVTNNANLYYNLGNAQRELGKSADAASSYRQALKLAPNDADTHNNLGNVLRELGKLEEAIASYQTALRLNPKLHHAKVHLVHQKQHICDWAGLNEDIAEIRDWVSNTPEAQVSPFAFLAMPSTTATEQKQCADNWLRNRYQGLFEQAKQLSFTYATKPTNRLRIGYLSGDFRLHPLASLITELLELHNREQFEIYAYSYALDDKTPERKRLERAFDHFVDIRSLSHSDAAKRINTDQIDILVDLTGFTQSSRTGIVALRPAPVTVSWLGFPGTMGSYQAENEENARPLFDYLLSDSVITPPDQAHHYAEKLALLPICYQPNDRLRPVAIAPTREQCGLPAQAFVFCCFNQTFKILPEIFTVWMRLLDAVPNSVLWLMDCNALAKLNLQQEAQARGIDSMRLVFAPRVAMGAHLARHIHADLFLDTLPYNAHTTASDALWMGLPVLTCMGDTFAGRVAASLLQAAGLPQLVTESLQAYEARALALAKNADQLVSIKTHLREKREKLPLFDTPAFTKQLEDLYQQMWQSYQAKNP